MSVETELADIKQRLDFLGPKMLDMSKKVDKIEDAMIQPTQVEIEQLRFFRNLAALQGVILTESQHITGHIKQITPHWPDGCNALVDIRVGRGVEQFCPREGFLSLNDATPTHPFNIPVSENDEIWVEMVNADAVNPHAITVTVTIQKG